MKRRSPVVCLAFSGGLDTTYCALLLREEGNAVHAVTVDTGGFSPAREADDRRAREGREGRPARLRGRAHGGLRALRAAAHLRQRAARRRLSALGGGRARRAGAGRGEPCAADRGAARSRTARRPPGTTSSASTPALRVLAPEIEVRAPVRDCGLSREEETAYCAARGVRIPPKTTRYSVNEGLWGTTIGGGETHDPWELPPETLYPGNTLAKAPRTPRLGRRRVPAGPPGLARRQAARRARARREAECPRPALRRRGARHPPGRYDSGSQGPHRLRGAGGARPDRGPRGAGEARDDEGAAAVEGARRRDVRPAAPRGARLRARPLPTPTAYPARHAGPRDGRGETALLAGTVRGRWACAARTLSCALPSCATENPTRTSRRRRPRESARPSRCRAGSGGWPARGQREGSR